MRWASPPTTEQQLLFRADRLAGRRLDEVAAALGAPVPADLRRNKGWIGEVLEAALGAEAGNRPVPDFERLGIELKTLPVDARGRARESTFVCSAPLDASFASAWSDSRVRCKLARVLWVPVVGGGPPAERVIGQPLLWSPDPAEDAQLEADWRELTDLLAAGSFWQLDARRGEALQLRPKAAHGDALGWAIGEQGDWVQAGPRAFYLRARFTTALLARRLRAG